MIVTDLWFDLKSVSVARSLNNFLWPSTETGRRTLKLTFAGQLGGVQNWSKAGGLTVEARRPSQLRAELWGPQTSESLAARRSEPKPKPKALKALGWKRKQTKHLHFSYHGSSLCFEPAFVSPLSAQLWAARTPPLGVSLGVEWLFESTTESGLINVVKIGLN